MNTMNAIIIDTETTGLSRWNDEVLEISIINQDGDILLDTLIQPVKKTEWPEAQAIHGISPEMIKANNAPTLQELAPTISSLINESDTVIAYNADYDRPFIDDALLNAGTPLDKEWTCAMHAFAIEFGEWNNSRDQFKWQKLIFAAAHAGHVWQGAAHRSLADCQATLSVWNWLKTKEASRDTPPLYIHAVSLVRRKRKALIGDIHKHLRIDFEQAHDLIQLMEKNGVISAASPQVRNSQCASRRSSIAID